MKIQNLNFTSNSLRFKDDSLKKESSSSQNPEKKDEFKSGATNNTNSTSKPSKEQIETILKEIETVRENRRQEFIKQSEQHGMIG